MATRKTTRTTTSKATAKSETWQSYNGEISPKEPLRNYTVTCTVSFRATFITDRANPEKAKEDAISGLKAAYAHRLNMSEDSISVKLMHIRDTTV